MLNAEPATALYRVTEAAPNRVAGRRVSPGGLMTLHPREARTEVEFGHLVPTTAEAEAQPMNLTEAERAALPDLPPLGDGPVEYALGVGMTEATGMPLTAVPMGPADGLERDYTLAGAEPAPSPEA